MSDGLDYFGIDDDSVGFDYMSLLSGAGGMLSGAGGLMGKPAGAADPAAAIEKQRLQDAKDRAEKSASTMKMVLIVVGTLAGVGVLALLTGRRAPAPTVAP